MCAHMCLYVCARARACVCVCTCVCVCMCVCVAMVWSLDHMVSFVGLFHFLGQWFTGSVVVLHFWGDLLFSEIGFCVASCSYM